MEGSAGAVILDMIDSVRLMRPAAAVPVAEILQKPVVVAGPTKSTESTSQRVGSSDIFIFYFCLLHVHSGEQLHLNLHFNCRGLGARQ